MKQTTVTQQTTADTWQLAPATTLLQRQCACGTHTTGGGQCDACHQSGPALEREADWAAGRAVRGETVPAASLSPAGPGAVQRQEGGGGGKKEKSDEEKYKEAAKKTGEAFMKTDVGQKIEKKVKELGEEFIGTLHGKIITGAAASGAIAALIATNKELPAQLPAIPLDIIAPGLSATITYEGPVRNPTKGSISFSYKFGAGQKGEKKPKQTESEKRRAETAKMQKEQHEFREGLKPPEQRKAEEEAYWKAYWRMRGADPLNPLNLPGMKPKEGASLLKMRRDEEEPAVQRKESGPSPAPEQLPASVARTLSASGQPLPPQLQQTMAARFGHDLSGVRVHSGGEAGRSAGEIAARAYTSGEQIVFAPGEYQPGSAAGQQLLAHELTHVVQQKKGSS
jgi:hypothetical protein